MFVSSMGRRVLGERRWIAVLGAVAGVAFWVERWQSGRSAYSAFLLGCGASVAVMLVAGVADRFWRHAELEEATTPAGWGLKFGQRTSRALRLLEERVDAETRDLSGRLARLEAVSRARSEAMDEQDDA